MKLNEEQKQTAIEVLDGFQKYYSDSQMFKEGIENFKKLHNLSPTIEVGKVYKDTDFPTLLVFITKIDGVIGCGYGIDNRSNWNNELSLHFNKNIIEAPIKEWIEVLKKEGDKYIGKTVKCLYDGNNRFVDSFKHIRDGKLWYSTNSEYLVCLMKDGIFAEIVSDEIIELKSKLKLKEINKLQKQLDNLQEQINELSK